MFSDFSKYLTHLLDLPTLSRKLFSHLFVLIIISISSLLLSSYLFALDIDTSKKLYLSYFEKSSQFGSYVRQAIYEELPLYRYFKIYFVGSAEKSESTKKTGEYLLGLNPFKDAKSDEEALARSIFMSYWEAKLNYKNFDEELIKNSPVFNEFFSQYQARVAEAFGNFAQDLAAYLLGVNFSNNFDKNIPESILNLKKSIISNFDYTPAYNGEEKETIDILLNNKDVIETISSIIMEVQQNTSNIEPEMLIMRTRGLIFRSVYAHIAGLKDELASIFVGITPKEKNLSWIRWIVYVAVLAFGYLLFKNFNIPITFIIAAETVYMGAFFNIQSTVDGMLYGLLLAIFILFSIGYYTYKKRYALVLISTLALAFLFIPSFFTEDLLIKNSFSSSPFYEILYDETFKDPLGSIQENLKSFNSIANESIQAFSNLLYELEVEGKEPEDSLEPENFSSRLAFAKKLRGEYGKDSEKLAIIDDFVYFENTRKKKAEKIIARSEKLFVKIASISSSDFKNKIIDFIESNYSENISKYLVSKVKSSRKLAYAAVPTYKVKTALIGTILLFAALFLNALNLSEAFIPLVGSIAVYILTLLKTQILFVQVGVPVLTIYTNIAIPFGLVLSLAFGYIWLRYNNINIRRREKV